MRLSGLVVVLGFVLLVAFFFPWMGWNPKEAAKRTACLSNLKQEALALNYYAADHDEGYPLRDVWMDGSRRYGASAGIERCPTAPPGGWGYAFNATLSGSKAPSHAEKAPLVYDSLNPIRNASDRFTSLPGSKRHGGKSNVAYADAHARSVVVK